MTIERKVDDIQNFITRETGDILKRVIDQHADINPTVVIMMLLHNVVTGCAQFSRIETAELVESMALNLRDKIPDDELDNRMIQIGLRFSANADKAVAESSHAKAQVNEALQQIVKKGSSQ